MFLSTTVTENVLFSLGFKQVPNSYFPTYTNDHLELCDQGRGGFELTFPKVSRDKLRSGEILVVGQLERIRLEWFGKSLIFNE
jgi:hypothetical protein